MTRRSIRLPLSVFALTGALTAGAFAQGYPAGFAPRCQPDELRIAPVSRDPCAPQFGAFGLNGPTVAGRLDGDIDATGSIPSSPPPTDKAERRSR